MPTLIVNNTNDSGPGSLRQAIADAVAGDTIIFNLTLPATITLTSGELVINKDLTIEGPGPTQLVISGDENSRVFFTFASVVVLRGLTISEGVSDHGSAVYVNGGSLTMENCRLSHNRAEAAAFTGGGAVYLFQAEVIITNCEILDNLAERIGGAFMVDIGSNVLIRNCTLERNRVELPETPAESPLGGAIWIHPEATVRIETSRLRNNRADGLLDFPGEGGAIHTRGDLTIVRSTLSSNSANVAGAVSQRSGTFTTVNSTYSGNSAPQGGSIYVFAGTCRISFCTIAMNNADNVGGLRVDPSGGGGGSDAVSVSIKNSLLASNPGGNCGGPITTIGVNMATDPSCPGFTQVSVMDLNLQPLALNPPGTTETHALGQGSVAINAAPDCTDIQGNPVSTDQRGVTRPQDIACDLGAYEFQSLKNMNFGFR